MKSSATSIGLILDANLRKANLTAELGGGKGKQFQCYLSRQPSIIESYHFSSVKYPKTPSPWNEHYYTMTCQKSRIMAALHGLRSRLVVQKTVAVDECVFMCLV